MAVFAIMQVNTVLFASLNKLIQKSVTRRRYFSIARATELNDGKKTSTFG